MKSVFIVLIMIAVISFTSCKDNNFEEMEKSQNNEESTSETLISLPAAEDLDETTESQDITVNFPSEEKVFYGKSTSDISNKTYTGLASLELLDFRYSANINFDTLSKSTISHSYGVAVNETAHLISKNFQKYFDDKSFDAVCLDDKSENKTLYLTFDCGYENGYTTKILDTLKAKNVKAAFFCTLLQMRDNPELISRMISEGHIVGNHSVTHPDFSTLSKEQIIDEIKGFDDYIRENFGYSSLFFRFPQGKYSEYAITAINDLGYKCVFWSLAYADWDTENQKGASYARETVMSRIHPGAVILLHSVSSDNAEALSEIIDLCIDKGYEFKSLTDL